MNQNLYGTGSQQVQKKKAKITITKTRNNDEKNLVKIKFVQCRQNIEKLEPKLLRDKPATSANTYM